MTIITDVTPLLNEAVQKIEAAVEKDLVAAGVELPKEELVNAMLMSILKALHLVPSEKK